MLGTQRTTFTRALRSNSAYSVWAAFWQHPFRVTQPQPYNKCFRRGHFGHWASFMVCPDLSNSPFYWFLSLDSQDSYFWVLASIWGPITVDYFASFVNGKCPSSIRNFFNLLVLVVYSLAFDWGRESCLLVPPVCLIPRVILIRSLPEKTSTTESQHRSLQDASEAKLWDFWRTRWVVLQHFQVWCGLSAP